MIFIVQVLVLCFSQSQCNFSKLLLREVTRWFHFLHFEHAIILIRKYYVSGISFPKTQNGQKPTMENPW